MHELLLFGQVPASRHDQVLKVLAGIAAMQPQLVTERHLVFKPKKLPGANGNPSRPKLGSQGSQMQAIQGQMHGDLFYLQLVGDVRASIGGNSQVINSTIIGEDISMAGGLESENADDTAVSDGTAQANMASADSDISSQKWSLEFRDLPEVPGRRPVTSRLMSSVPIMDGDPIRFMDALGYNFMSEYVLHGHQLIYNNIILLLSRPLLAPFPKTGQQAIPVPQLPPVNTLQPLDPSNTVILQASIRVQDGTKPETVTIGSNELKAFKETMKGVVEMEVGDRLALDTRVR